MTTAAPPDESSSYLSAGVAVRVDLYRSPGTASPGPAVLLLHGAEGLGFGDSYRIGARGLATAGFHVGLVHYLDRTAERRVTFATVARNFPAWAEAVRHGLDWVGTRPEVDVQRVGLVGISLGATLALQVASDDERVRAVVDFFGPLPAGIPVPRRFPPTLVLHGERDSLVPVAHAHRVAALLKEHDVAHEVVLFADQGHGFHGAAQAEASARVSLFLEKTLQKSQEKGS